MSSIQNRYELQVQTFLKNIMDNPGFFVKIPVALSKEIKKGEFTEEEKAVFSQTIEMLDMMDIKYQFNPNSLSIMIEPIGVQK